MCCCKQSCKSLTIVIVISETPCVLTFIKSLNVQHFTVLPKSLYMFMDHVKAAQDLISVLILWSVIYCVRSMQIVINYYVIF